MIFKALKFTLIFSFLIGLAYVIQVKSLQASITAQDADLIKFSYLFNFAFTYFLMVNILLFQNKLKDKLGFVYLGVSMLKFAVFFFLLKIENIEINKSDFLLFIIPFVLCLSIEIFYVVRILNSFNYIDDKELE
tara:strand:- start:73 stop:474 length:402 start_codon:yes stop_codon:yes gene_type:complete